MCQRFFTFSLVFSWLISTNMHADTAIPGQVFAVGPGGFSVIRLVNDGMRAGWVDIANQTGVSVTGKAARPVTLVNYEKENRPQFILDPALNHASRKFNFKGVRNIACYIHDKQGNLTQVHCNNVVSIPYYYPYPTVFATYWNDLELI